MARQISAAVGLSFLIGYNEILSIDSFGTPGINNIPFLASSQPFGIVERSSSTSLYARITNLNQPFANSKDDDENENDEEDDEDDSDEEDDDFYSRIASSEFNDEEGTELDWGSALGSLRQRMGDIEKGKSQNPSNALFRLMSRDSPNEAIGKFVEEANPEVLAAMSGAVSGLLGSLSNPTMGIETIVKANGQKVASLCFQLQMTGYMFRNAEYVVALKDLMNIRGASVTDFKKAFDRLDSNKSGFIEASEIDALLSDVYDGAAPAFEVKAFLRFFDANKDGKISWEEFEKGLGAINPDNAAKSIQKSLPGFAMNVDKNQNADEEDDEDDDYDDDDDFISEPTLSGTIEIEMEDGKIIEVEAKDYIENLKVQAQALKEALRREKGESSSSDEISPGAILSGPESLNNNGNNNGSSGGITALIASLGGDLKQLTQGISPDVVDTMKLLVDFVLEGGSNKRQSKIDLEQEMELPGSALQQLALWQLVLGYRLREAEATGDYKRLLDN